MKILSKVKICNKEHNRENGAIFVSPIELKCVIITDRTELNVFADVCKYVQSGASVFQVMELVGNITEQLIFHHSL